ncbi:MAG: ATP-binding protein [Candidatus Sumerlaeota bacterium]
MPATPTPIKVEVCDKCHGAGYVVKDGVAHRCDCGIMEAFEGRVRVGSAEVPRRFATKDFTNFKAEKKDRDRGTVLETAKAYANTFNGGESEGLLLRGITGCGKTHIAIAILKEVIRRGYSGYYANFNDLLSRIRDSYNADSGASEAELLDAVDSAQLLVLDDVGAESTTDWVRDRLYLIVNRRYENALPTIITTNCDEAELQARVGPRIVSRLYEMCSFDFPPFPKQDFRRAQMK